VPERRGELPGAGAVKPCGARFQRARHALSFPIHIRLVILFQEADRLATLLLITHVQLVPAAFERVRIVFLPVIDTDRRYLAPDVHERHGLSANRAEYHLGKLRVGLIHRDFLPTAAHWKRAPHAITRSPSPPRRRPCRGSSRGPSRSASVCR